MLREKSKEFSGAIDQDIQWYFDRVDYRLNDERLTYSRKLLIEEIAVSDISQCLNPANEVYPGPRLTPEILLASDPSLPSTPIKSVNFLEVHF